MPSEPTRDITEALRRWKEGDPGSGDELIPLVHAELRRIAGTRLRGLRRKLQLDGLDASLETAGLINEAYMRLLDERAGYRSRAHFFAIAATQMRRICVDYARRIQSLKRGRGTIRRPVEDLEDGPPPGSPDPVDLLDLHRALEDLEALDPRQGRIVELKYFAGLTEREIGDVLGISEATVRREWTTARAWLFRALGGSAA